MDYIMKILRTICYYIDNVVFEGMGHVYDLLLRIARTSIFNGDTIKGFYEKVYALIGIFMLFKISFSLITYILNPDEFSDKEKGFASIIKRVVLSLVMLVLVPYGFQEAYEVQTIILEDNTLAALIFDDIDNNENAIYQIDTAGDKMKYIIMYTFFQPNYSGLAELDASDYLASCAITYDRNDDGSVNVQEDTGIFILNPECFGTLTDDKYPVEGDYYGQFWGSEYADKEDLYQTYAHGIERQNFYLLFKLDIALAQTAEKNGVYLVNYMAPLSTVVGIVVLWILLMFCIDIAVRSVKLGFYELIAPIPILSYIDPKTKDGMLSKWFKQVSTTYLSLFIRLLTIYLAIFIINQVFQNGIADVVTGERIHDWWVLIFIVVGTLMFAKQLPKILEDTLGIKGSGDFTLNPIKKLEDGMIGGKTLTKPIKGAAALGKGVARGATIGVGSAALVGAAGLVTGQGFRAGAMGKALWGAAKGEKFGKNFASSYGAGRARKKQLDQMRADGVDPGDVRAAKWYNAFHGESKADKVATLESQAKAIQSYYDAIKGQAVACDKTDVVDPTTGKLVKSAKTISKEIEEMKKTTINRQDFKTDAEYQKAVTDQKNRISQAESELEARINHLAAGISSGTVTTGTDSADKVIREATASMQTLVAKSNALGESLDSEFVKVSASGTDVVGMMKQAKGTAAQAGSGKMSGIKDVGKYADGSKK